MICIGIDPGYNLGFAVIEPIKKKLIYSEIIDCRQFKTKALQGVSFFTLFEKLHVKLKEHATENVLVTIEDSTVIKQYNHQAVQSLTGTKISAVMAFEKFYSKNKNSTLLLLKPMTIKKLVTGKGNAKKEEVLYWVNNTFKTDITFKENHISDAISIAYSGYIFTKK